MLSEGEGGFQIFFFEATKTWRPATHYTYRNCPQNSSIAQNPKTPTPKPQPKTNNPQLKKSVFVKDWDNTLLYVLQK